MMLFKISLKNIRKSIKDYAIYFFTLVLGVAIFYVFNSINSQTVMMNVTKRTYEIIDLMTNLLSGVSVFVSFILGFLIIYASRFLMKRRNKEFGIYLTLGMSKRKISLILFIETLLIGVISLIVGLILGVFLSQFMSILVANMFEADMTRFKFIFSSSACIKTLIYFGIMYLLVILFNTISVSKCKLIDLIYSSKKMEKVKIKNPVICIIIFIISVCMLSYAYYLVTDGIDAIKDYRMILIPIALGIISTFLIFWSLSGLLLKITMSIKKLYYKGLNCFTLRQISSKVNTTVFSMTIISIMLFITICVLSSSLALKSSMTANVNSLTPVDIQLEKSRNLDYDNNIDKTIIDDSYISIEETLKNLNIDQNTYFLDNITVNKYVDDNLTLNDTLGSTSYEVSKEYKYLRLDNKEVIMKLSDYNKVAKLYNKKTYTLNDDEYIIIADYDSFINIRNRALKLKEQIKVFDSYLYPKYEECQYAFVDMGANHSNLGIIIVPDKVVKEESIKSSIMLANYKDKSNEKLEEKLENIINNHYNIDTYLSYNTKSDIRDSSVGLGALVTFIGLYLGIIFLISSAAILALKELSESADNKLVFICLRKLGADEGMINKALFRQIGIFFLFPLILAIIHSIFGIRFCTFILESFGNDKLLPSIIMTSILLIIIYGGYFILTYLSSKNMIKE